MIVWLDGRFIADDAATISIHDRAFLAGDGVFETALLHDGGFFRMRQHLDRFVEGAAMLRIAVPDPVELDAIAREVVRRNGLHSAGLRFTLSRGVDAPVLLVTARAPDEAAIRRARQGWRLITARTRRPSTAAVPAQLKSLGRPWATLARIEAATAAVDDALLLTDDGIVCEGPAWNVFWRSGSVLFTPALAAGVLAGVTRSAILELCAAVGLEARETLQPRAALDDAEEIFATMTSAGIVPIRELDGSAIPDSTAAAALLSRYEALVAEQTASDPV